MAARSAWLTSARARLSSEPPAFNVRRSVSGKGVPGKVERGAGGILKAKVSQVVGDQGSFFELLTRRGQPVAYFSELEKGSVSRQLFPK